MCSEPFINDIPKILSDNNKGIKHLSVKFKDSNLSKKEKTIIQAILSIESYQLPISADYDKPYNELDTCIKTLEKETLKTFATASYEPKFKAKAYELLWIYFKDYQSYKEAYNNFMLLIEDKNTPFEDNVTYIIRAFTYLYNNKKNINENEINKLENIIFDVIKANFDDKYAFTLNLLKMVFKKYKQLKKTLDNSITDIIMQKLDKLEIHYNNNIYISYIELLEKIYAYKNDIKNLTVKTNDSSIIEYRELKVNFYSKSLDTAPSIHAKIYTCKKIIEILKSIPNSQERRNKVEKQLNAFQKQSIELMHTIKYEINCSEQITAILNDFKSLSLGELITKFALYKMPLNLNIDLPNPLLNFPPVTQTSIVDNDGKNIAIINNDDTESVEIQKIHDISTKESQLFIMPILKYIKTTFSSKDIMHQISNIIDESMFVPNDRRNLFKDGFKYVIYDNSKDSFDFNFRTSLHILLPQAENSIRYLAQFYGDSIYKTDSNDIDGLLSLDSILNAKRLNQNLDESLILDMKRVLTSKYGLNMRNLVAHGCLDDNSFYSPYAAYTWWFILKLCCLFKK